MNFINIQTLYIRLDQFLKLCEISQSGGESKVLIQEGRIFVNEQREIRRGRKLFSGDIVRFGKEKYQIVNGS